MKTILVSGGINVFVTNEEWNLISKSNGLIDRKKLTERETVIADHLHKRGIFTISRRDDGVYYRLNKNGFL